MSKQKDNKLVLVGIIILVFTAFGFLAKYDKLDDLGGWLLAVFGG